MNFINTSGFTLVGFLIVSILSVLLPTLLCILPLTDLKSNLFFCKSIGIGLNWVNFPNMLGLNISPVRSAHCLELPHKLRLEIHLVSLALNAL